MGTMTQERVPPSLQPSSRADLEKKRHGVLAEGPSGAVYRIRKVNLARHAEAGGMTARLREAAVAAISKGATSPVEALQELKQEEVSELFADERGYLDRLVIATVIEPALTEEDLGTGELADDPVLPTVDYEWLLQVARGREYRDGRGRWLWGSPPLDAWEIWIKAHGCGDNCADCVDAVSVYTAPAASPA